MSTTAKAPLFLLDSQSHEEVICIPLAPSELRTGRQTIVLFDLYCDNDDCGAVLLAVYRVDGEVTAVERSQDGRVRITARRPAGHLPDLYCTFAIRLSDGVVSFPKDHAPAAGDQDLLDQVQTGLRPEHLDLLRRRQRQRTDQGEDWKERDWSWVQKGMCVGWAELFPESEAWTFEHEGVPIFVVDQYCATASCDCSEVILSYFRVERRGPHDSEGVLLGAVRYDLHTGRHELESAAPGSSSAKTVLQLTETLFKALPATHDELKDRFGFMRGFANWLAQRRRERRPQPAGAPGRNDPCPCGSGRKYKKCCLP